MLKNWLELLHYSRLPFCVLAMTATAAIAKVLAGQIAWQPVLIVGLSTYVIYSLDNLLDWPGEKHLLETIQPRWNTYFMGSILTIPLALGSIFLLTLQSTFKFLILLTAFGVISGAEVLLTRQLRGQDRSALALWVERLIDSLTWALVLVLIPVQYASQPLVAQSILIILYAWYLSWIIVMVWDLTRSATGGRWHPTPVLSELWGEHRLIRVLQISSLLAIGLHGVDMFLGYFPWPSISALFAPTASFVLLSLWSKLRRFPQLYSNLFILADAVGCLLIIVFYLVAEQG